METFIIVALVLLGVLAILDKYEITKKDSLFKQTAISALRSILWHYIACWSVWGLVFYMFVAEFVTTAIFSFSFLWLFLAAVLFFVCWPITLLFHWIVYKIKQQKTIGVLNIICTLIAIGLFLYPFIEAWVNGGISQLIDYVGDGFEHMTSVFSRPDGVYSLLFILLAANIASIIYSPLFGICSIAVAIGLFFAMEKLISKFRKRGRKFVRDSLVIKTRSKRGS